LNQEFLRILRVMGVTVNQGFNQEAVLNSNYLVVMEGYLPSLVAKEVASGLQFVAPDVTLIQNGIVHPAFAQEVAAGQAGAMKTKIKGMVGGQSVKSIKFSELTRGDDVADERGHIKSRFSKVDVYPVDDPVNQFLELSHNTASLERGYPDRPIRILCQQPIEFI
jgi:hypothetical protein